MTNRRAFILGLGATLAVIRTPGLLMPIKPVVRQKTNKEVMNVYMDAIMRSLHQEIQQAEYEAIVYGVSYIEFSGEKIRISAPSAGFNGLLRIA